MFKVTKEWLEKTYKELNKQLFDNQCPKDIDLKFGKRNAMYISTYLYTLCYASPSDRRKSVVEYKGIKVIPIPPEIFINTIHENANEDIYKKNLIHSMIHAWVYNNYPIEEAAENGESKKQHGTFFMDKMAKVNERLEDLGMENLKVTVSMEDDTRKYDDHKKMNEEHTVFYYPYAKEPVLGIFPRDKSKLALTLYHFKNKELSNAAKKAVMFIDVVDDEFFSEFYIEELHKPVLYKRAPEYIKTKIDDGEIELGKVVFADLRNVLPKESVENSVEFIADPMTYVDETKLVNISSVKNMDLLIDDATTYEETDGDDVTYREYKYKNYDGFTLGIV